MSLVIFTGNSLSGSNILDQIVTSVADTLCCSTVDSQGVIVDKNLQALDKIQSDNTAYSCTVKWIIYSSESDCLKNPFLEISRVLEKIKEIGLNSIDLFLIGQYNLKFDQFLPIWKILEQFVSSGHIKSLGVVDFKAVDLENLIKVSTVSSSYAIFFNL